jgi:hypothetical protein
LVGQVEFVEWGVESAARRRERSSSPRAQRGTYSVRVRYPWSRSLAALGMTSSTRHQEFGDLGSARRGSLALRAFVLNEHRYSDPHRSSSRNRPNSACARSTIRSFFRSFFTFPAAARAGRAPFRCRALLALTSSPQADRPTPGAPPAPPTARAPHRRPGRRDGRPPGPASAPAPRTARRTARPADRTPRP